MKLSEKIQKIIALGEGFTSEFKKSGISNLGRELCAFVNANVQVHIFHDRVEITNPGGLPAGMTPELLGKKSIPRNSLLFSIFHRMDMVERLGSGIKRIKELCRDYGLQEPEIEIEEGWFTVIFKRSNKKETKAIDTDPVRVPVGTKSALSRHQVEMLYKCSIDSGITELMAIAERSDRTKFRNQVLNPLIEARLLEMTSPDKPRSSKQKYRITERGKKIIESNKDE